MEGRAKKVEGNVDYPINQGKHSARCEAGLQALYHPDRIRGPWIRVGDRGSGRFKEISWTEAIARLTLQLENLQGSGRQSAMVMVTDPVGAHLGMVVERFVSRFGGRHMPYEPLERTNVRAAIRQVFGQEVMPDFDIENAAYVLSFGADFLNTWVSPVRYARGYGRFRQGDRDRGTLVHVDSRFSMTTANADEWVYVRPGMEGLLALSIAHVIISEGLGDSHAAQAMTGDGAVLSQSASPEIAGAKVGVEPERIRRIAHEFAEHSPALALGGGSAAAHTNGLSNLVAIYSLNHLVGTVGRPGGVIFNPKPPLADVPTAPAVASFEDWRRLVAEVKQGQVQVLMVRGADPVYGLPASLGFEDALFPYRDSQGVPFIYSFSGIMDDTTSMADLILPEHSYLEDWGSDIPDPGPGYETVGFQQPVVRPFFEARGVHLGTRSFGDALLAVAQGLELDLGLPGDSFQDVLQDGARKLFAMNRGSVRASDFGSFWRGALQRGGWWDASARSAGAAPPQPAFEEAEGPDYSSTDRGRYPFHLIPFASASLGDGKGAPLPWLQATPDPVTTATWQTWVEINHRVAGEKASPRATSSGSARPTGPWRPSPSLIQACPRTSCPFP